MCWFIEEVGTISDCITALMAIAALAAAWRAVIWSKRTFRHQIIDGLFKEYRSNEMGTSIRRLNEYFKECGSDKDALVEKYIQDYNKEKGDDTIHHHRRTVSNFYQQVAVLAYKDKYIRDISYEIWKRRDLEIIETIITPVEVRAMRTILGQDPILEETKYPKYVKRTLKFYRKSPMD